MASRLLAEADRARVEELVAADPVANVFVASRLAMGVLKPTGPGELWGYPADAPRSLLHVGANLVPVAADAAACRAFAQALGPYRAFSAIVGVRAQVERMLAELQACWGLAYSRTRAIRWRQPLLATDRLPAVEPDPRVRRITRTDLESYFSAAVAMYTEELEEDPLASNPHGYRRYVEGLIDGGRAHGIVEDGEVIFKTDIGAIGGGVAQIQGVWVHPRLRGRGIAGPAVAAVTARIVRAGFTASLYVNDFNVPALATYRRCGYVERGVFATVMY